MKKPEPPPPGGKDYASSKAIEQARQAARDADRVGVERGVKFGKALGDAQEALKTLHRLTAGALPRILKSTPKFVDELQSGLATTLNAIPELPTYADPKLTQIARKGFERGFGAGLSDAKQKATAVYLAGEVALALSGEAAILTERAGAAALKGALARLKGMPVFIPGTIEGGGAFFRLPKPPIAQAARGEGVANVLKDATPGKVSKPEMGSTHYSKSGGFQRANADFDSLAGPNQIKTYPGDIRSTTLSDGTKVSVRPGSSQGDPTLQVEIPGQNPIKVRYDQ